MLTILYGVKTVQLTRGMNTLIDEADWPLVSPTSWNASSTSNGHTYAKGRRGNEHVFLHRLIANPLSGEIVDHKNADTLDNRRENLRVCSHADNCRNSGKFSGESKYKGVRKRKESRLRRERWRARIVIDQVTIDLGTYDTPEDAARAYDAAALKHHGAFARTNAMIYGEF